MEKKYQNEKHCFFCENRKLDLQRGLVCSITDSKREIRRKCLDFEFRLDKTTILKDFNEEYENPKNEKSNIIGSAIKWILIGVAGFIFGLVMFIKIYDMGWIYMLPIGIMLSGLGSIPYGIGIYLKGMQTLKALNEKQEEYSHFLNLYERRR